MQPGVERAHRRAGVAQKDLQMILQEIFFAKNDAAERSALAVDVFRRGMHHDIGAEFHRPLERGRCKGIVGHRKCAGGVRNPAYACDIDDFKRWIGWCFKE